MSTTVQTPDYTAIKATQQQMWASGDYAVVAARIQSVAEELVAAAEIRAGWNVLDVATGSGNAAIAAARHGASVVGIDYVPELLAAGRARAEAERVVVDFREGDAEDLPVDTGSFDAVTSVFGSMFAPNHVQTAQEIARACRPGGTIGLASWTPDGFIGQILKVVGSYAPPPAGVTSPARWGAEEHIAEIFGDTITDVRATERTYTWHFTSAMELVTWFEVHYGPTNRAFAKQNEAGRAGMTADLVALIEGADVIGDGSSIAVPATYLEVVATRA